MPALTNRTVRVLDMAECALSDPREIVTRKQAKAAGLKRYFTGKSCKRGHVADRMTICGSCCVCSSVRSAAWKDRNRDHVNQYARAYMAALPVEKKRERDRLRAVRHPRRTSAYAKAWTLAHPEHAPIKRALNRAWKSTNRDLVNGYARKAYRADPAKFASKSHTRRLRMSAGGCFTGEEVAEIRKMQRDCCGACRVKLNGKGEIDHIIPLSKGGGNGRKNLQLLCKSCNARKGAKHPIEFMQSIGRLL